MPTRHGVAGGAAMSGFCMEIAWPLRRSVVTPYEHLAEREGLTQKALMLGCGGDRRTRGRKHGGKERERELDACKRMNQALGMKHE